jgi:FlaA1/EpsC-like NDP-sugar epimerase
VLVLTLALLGAVVLRFDGDPSAMVLKRTLFICPYVVGLEFLSLYLAGVTRFSWRYVGLREIVPMSAALGLSTVALLGAWGVTVAVGDSQPWLQYVSLPLGVIAINGMLALIGVAGIRAARRIWSEHYGRLQRPGPQESLTTILVGAGEAGVQVAKELAGHAELGLRAAAFVDDDPAKQGLIIHGIAVRGTVDDLPHLARTLGAEQVVVSIASATGKAMRRIMDRCRLAGVPVRVIPGITQILRGEVAISRLRPVSIEDLLRRGPVSLETELIARMISGSSVMVTGAGGSIGSELVRQLAGFAPRRLVLLERCEAALWAIHHEMKRVAPGLDLVPLLCDVSDAVRVRHAFETFGTEIVFHAAAHKHVPLVEENPGEALRNNVFGTRAVAEAAHQAKVKAMVFISTDKAVNPSSIMGATKRLGEMVVQALGAHSETRFVAVRFGNVLGSAGSVVPIFQEQIAQGAPVSVTHPEMRRYFMTTSEACQLVMQAAAMGKGGEIFVLDMGEPVRILDLAHDLIRLSGLQPGEDIPIEFTGIRPGEKLFEEFEFDAEKMDKTCHPKIWVGRLGATSWETLAPRIEALGALVGERDRDRVRAALRALIPEMLPEDLPETAPPIPSQREPVAARPAAALSGLVPQAVRSAGR